ncbi:hypothetical protein HBH64_003670 [Parastagonospora nodorum]|nr:hypothetical protein HBH49_221670 [Parastagonospora nodorum]KAH4312589.1 hypothetical protein HBI01_001210 [Parastagonospora nodorum]KAH4316011.1 hypothetical protein HBI02_038810 [Parastagonospora nodorum]KAH4327345.1 hypothetical protein HBI00_129890 [Parastagonospora nodorum]KAH4391029.1 hypothetical protein HBH94_023170 [Parastagonospora nodorum]
MGSQDCLQNTPPLSANFGSPKEVLQKLTILDDPVPTKVFARLELSQECYLSGSIPFTFVIEFSTNSKEPITIDKLRSPLSVFVNDLNTIDKLIECRNVDTEEEVNWSAFFGCYDFDPHPSFPADDDFVEISIDKPWRFECTLENMDCEYDTVRSMFGLESSQKYSTRIADSALSAFSRWQCGRKEDLLSGLEEE